MGTTQEHVPMTAYPRFVRYSRVRWDGWPFVQRTSPTVPNLGGPLDMTLLTNAAKCDALCTEATPWYEPNGPGRTDALLALRRLNPDLKVFMYQLAFTWYLGPTVSRTGPTFADHWHRAIQETDGFGPQSGLWFVKWENPATEKRLTALLVAAYASGLFDGLSLDYGDSWTGDIPGATRAFQRCIHALQERGAIVVVNGARNSSADGALVEGWPTHFGHTPDGVRALREGRPHKRWDWLQAGVYADPTLPASQQTARFAAGWACLWDMAVSVGPDRDVDGFPGYAGWTFPELEPGWLGEPLGPAYMHLGCWRRDFSRGVVFVNVTASAVNVTGLPEGLRRSGDPAWGVGSVTVPSRDAVFLQRDV
jgi:hypothetical protein